MRVMVAKHLDRGLRVRCQGRTILTDQIFMLARYANQESR